MKTKYYAVKVGRKVGIFYSWDDCKTQVDGYKGAKYKSFTDINEANAYINGDSSNTTTFSSDTPYAFVDGSYNAKTNVYGYGGFLVDGDHTYTIQGSGDKPELAAMRNVAGEICGVIKAVKLALDNNLKNLTIYYDYAGLEAWANGEWKANKEYTQKYVRCINHARESLNIKFVKVAAHTGIPGNEKADELAKKACGIE